MSDDSATLPILPTKPTSFDLNLSVKPGPAATKSNIIGMDLTTTLNIPLVLTIFRLTVAIPVVVGGDDVMVLFTGGRFAVFVFSFVFFIVGEETFRMVDIRSV